MSNFTPKELQYLASQRLGRLATINEKNEPQNAPVGFRYNVELDVIDIGGRMMNQTKKFRNVQQNAAVSLVIDDVLPPWIPRGIEIRGTAEALGVGGKSIFAQGGASADYWDEAFIRITPTQIIGWGIDEEGYVPRNRKIAGKL